MPINTKTSESAFIRVVTSDKELCQRKHLILRTLGAMTRLCDLLIGQQTTIDLKLATTNEGK